MKDRTPEELMILLGRMSGLKKHHSSDQEFVGDLDWRHLIQVVACECILTIQLHMPRNGVSSPENLQSKRHIKDICDKFGIDMSSFNPRTLEFDNVMAGAEVVEDFGGYEESTHEKQAEFAKKRNYEIPKIEKCLVCGEPATWMRGTQFAGDHPFCEEHAKQEDDFGEDDSYTFWYEIK